LAQFPLPPFGERERRLPAESGVVVVFKWLVLTISTEGCEKFCADLQSSRQKKKKNLN
jgi:hypothetical protein